MERHDVYLLADKVARELSDARQAHRGQHWSMVNGREKAVPFEVTAPSLVDMSLADVAGLETDFDFMVCEARPSSAEHRWTYLFHCDRFIVAEDGLTYTGQVIIRDRDFDWQR